MTAQPVISSTAVARSFSTAAATYDQYADMQRDVVLALIKKIREAGLCKMPTRILNFGSGTGFCCDQLAQLFPEADIINLDIALGMLAYHASRSESPRSGFVCGDVSKLPFEDSSFDLVFSSLALQWCTDTRQVFEELRRVCQPSSPVFISTLGPDTLNEVRLLWQGIDDKTHVNDFLDTDTLKQHAASARLVTVGMEKGCHVRKYFSLRELGRELRGLGAHNLNVGQPRGLTGRKKFRQLEQRFSECSDKGCFSAGFNVILMQLAVLDEPA